MNVIIWGRLGLGPLIPRLQNLDPESYFILFF